MATSPDQSAEDDIAPEYNFRELQGVVRGKYTHRYNERLRVVRLEEDVASAFPDEDAVNAALRDYLSGKSS